MASVNPDDGPGQHPSTLRNETPQFLTNIFGTGLLFLQSYGWYLLIGAVVLLYLKSKYLPNIKKHIKQRNEQWEHNNQNPETVRQRQEKLEAARRRMQEEHDAQAARFAEEQKKRDEAKRKEKIEDWDRHQEGKGYRSKYKPSESQEKPSTSGTSSSSSGSSKSRYRKTDYSPLMGGGGGASFRPPRKGPSGGG